jgi:hypothetical protein
MLRPYNGINGDNGNNSHNGGDGMQDGWWARDDRHIGFRPGRALPL